MRRIVVNENRNRYRKHRVAERLTGSPPESAAAADATRQYDERSALVAALQRLGPRQRAVIVLRYWLDLTEDEAAAALNAPRARSRARPPAPWPRCGGAPNSWKEGSSERRERA